MMRRLARIASRFKKTEKVGKAQLVLFLDALQRGEGEPEVDGDNGGPDEVDEADEKLRAASGADDLKRDDELAALKTRRTPQPESPVPDTSHLPHVPNPLLVPASERACATCGEQRVSIGPDVRRLRHYTP